MKADIRLAGPQDIPLIYNLAEKIWNIHYPAIISTEQIRYMLAKFYSPEALMAQMKNGHRFHLISLHGKAVGYLSESNETDVDYFLHKFYIDPEYQGAGMGREVYRSIFSSRPGIQTVRLTVNRANFMSVNFYFRLGFVIEKTADFDIGNGYFMNDFVMIHRL